MVENSKDELLDFPWYSWGSPIGLGIASICAAISFSVVALSAAKIYELVKAAGI